MDKIVSELEEVKIELNMCRKRLAHMSNKAIVLHSKLTFTSDENDQIKSYVGEMKNKYILLQAEC